MGKTNRLSKRLNWKVGVENNNDNQTLIKEQQIHNLSGVVIKGPEVEKIKIARVKDKEIVKVVEEMKKTEIKVLQEDEWQIEVDLYYKLKFLGLDKQINLVLD